MEVLASKFQVGEYENLNTCRALLPHAQAVLAYKNMSDDAQHHRANLLYRLSWFQFMRGQYDNAYRTALDFAELNKGCSTESDPKLHNLRLEARI